MRRTELFVGIAFENRRHFRKERKTHRFEIAASIERLEKHVPIRHGRPATPTDFVESDVVCLQQIQDRILATLKLAIDTFSHLLVAGFVFTLRRETIHRQFTTQVNEQRASARIEADRSRGQLGDG